MKDDSSLSRRTLNFRDSNIYEKFHDCGRFQKRASKVSEFFRRDFFQAIAKNNLRNLSHLPLYNFIDFTKLIHTGWRKNVRLWKNVRWRREHSLRTSIYEPTRWHALKKGRGGGRGKRECNLPYRVDRKPINIHHAFHASPFLLVHLPNNPAET